MAFTKTDFPGLIVYEPKVHEDDRGYFFECYNENTFLLEGISFKFVQDNQARSTYGVIRGLHYQLNPHAQTKLVRVLSGIIMDVVVDIRKGSPTFGRSFSLELSEKNKKQLLIPKGFAHGYAVLSESAEVFYKCDDFYDRSSEGGIIYNDPVLNIDWGISPGKEIISTKDTKYPGLNDCINNFVFES